jgi:hypothetical protein
VAVKKTRTGLAFFLFIILVSACSFPSSGSGMLQGQISIGPLVPAVGPGVEIPTPGSEIFEGREIVIFNEKGTRELQRVQITAPGYYQVTLATGRYTVDINHLGIDHAAGLPAVVEIFNEQVTVLDIDIDTGIR